MRTVGVDNNQQEAAVYVAKTAVIAAAGAEQRQLWRQQRLKRGGGGGGGIDDGRDRRLSTKSSSGSGGNAVVFILFWFFEARVHSLCMFVLYCNLLLREKGVPANLQYQKVPTKFSSGIGLVNTKKYQPNTDQKYQIGIQLYEFQGD